MEIDPNDIAELTTLIFSAALQPPRWWDFVQRLHEISGGVRPHLFGRDTRHGQLFSFVGAGYDPAHMRSYSKHYHTKNVWVDSFSSLANGAYLPIASMYPRDELHRTEFYNEWIKPQENIFGGGGSMIFNEKERFLAFGGHIRERDIDKLERRFEHLVKLLTPHVQKAFEISRVLEGKELSETVARRAGAAILLVRRDGRIIFANTAAEELIASGDILQADSSDYLKYTDRTLFAFVEPMLKGISEVDGAASAEHRQAHRESGEEVVFRAARFMSDRQRKSPFGVLYSGDEPCLMLTIERRKGGRQRALAVLRRHELTKTEIAVARELGKGKSAREVAERRGVSVHTVRNQRQAILSKLDFRRQAQLIQLLSQDMR